MLRISVDEAAGLLRCDSGGTLPTLDLELEEVGCPAIANDRIGEFDDPFGCNLCHDMHHGHT